MLLIQPEQEKRNHCNMIQNGAKLNPWLCWRGFVMIWDSGKIRYFMLMIPFEYERPTPNIHEVMLIFRSVFFLPKKYNNG